MDLSVAQSAITLLFGGFLFAQIVGIVESVLLVGLVEIAFLVQPIVADRPQRLLMAIFELSCSFVAQFQGSLVSAIMMSLLIPVMRLIADVMLELGDWPLSLNFWLLLVISRKMRTSSHLLCPPKSTIILRVLLQSIILGTKHYIIEPGISLTQPPVLICPHTFRLVLQIEASIAEIMKALPIVLHIYLSAIQSTFLQYFEWSLIQLNVVLLHLYSHNHKFALLHQTLQLLPHFLRQSFAVDYFPELALKLGFNFCL